MAKYICPKCNGTAEYTMFAYKCNDCGTIFESLEKGIYEQCTFPYHDWFRQKLGTNQWNWVERQLESSREKINRQIFALHEEYEAHCLANGITPDTRYALGKPYTMIEIKEDANAGIEPSFN